MHQMKILETILNSDPRKDWQRLGRGGTSVCFYRGDVNIRFESTLDEDDHCKFHEDWARKHPDPNAWRDVYYLYYGPSLIDAIVLVSVDGGRAQLPLPQLQDKRFNRLHYKVAEIFDTNGQLDEYVRRCGFAEYDRSVCL